MYRPKLGQNVYLVFKSNSITLDKVVMKGKDDFAVSMTFDELFEDSCRKPIRYDEYGITWFTSLAAAKNAVQRWMRRSKMQPRYINANELKSRIDLNEHNTGVIERWIDMCPTADVKPVVHSHWRFIGYATWKCVECGHETMDDEYKFCPEYGATMDENEEDYRTCISKQ